MIWQSKPSLPGQVAFLPLGWDTDFEPGEEEYFPAGNYLVIERVSIEAASLRAILSSLGPGPVPEQIRD